MDCSEVLLGPWGMCKKQMLRDKNGKQRAVAGRHEAFPKPWWWRRFQELSLLEAASVPHGPNPTLGVDGKNTAWASVRSRERNLCLHQAGTAQVQVLNTMSRAGAQPGCKRWHRAGGVKSLLVGLSCLLFPISFSKIPASPAQTQLCWILSQLHPLHLVHSQDGNEMGWTEEGPQDDNTFQGPALGSWIPTNPSISSRGQRDDAGSGCMSLAVQPKCHGAISEQRPPNPELLWWGDKGRPLGP